MSTKLNARQKKVRDNKKAFDTGRRFNSLLQGIRDLLQDIEEDLNCNQKVTWDNTALLKYDINDLIDILDNLDNLE